MENKSIENERTLGPVASRGAAEAVAALQPAPYLSLPGSWRRSRRLRLRQRALRLWAGWTVDLHESPAAGLRAPRIAVAAGALLVSASLVTWSDGLN